MMYRHNAKAWMITLHFQEWIQNFDRQVGSEHQGQQVLLLLDNCSSHSLAGLTLQYTDVCFLPPNTTPIYTQALYMYFRSSELTYLLFVCLFVYLFVCLSLTSLLLQHVESEDLHMNVLQAI